MTEYPLRNKRRHATRMALLAAAAKLFSAEGFSNATLDKIAEDAEVHVQTLFKHFPNKQALAAALHRAEFEKILNESTLDTLQTWRKWVKYSAEKQLSIDGGQSFQRYVQDREVNPKLADAVAEIAREYTQLLTERLAFDFNMDPKTDTFPALVASMLWGGNAHVVRQWCAAGGKTDLSRMVVYMVDDVIKIVNQVKTTFK